MYLMPVVAVDILKFDALLKSIKTVIADFEYIYFKADKFDYSEVMSEAYKIIMFEYDSEKNRNLLKDFRIKNPNIIVITACAEFTREDRIFFIENNIYYIDYWKSNDDNARYITKILLNKINITFKFQKKNWFEFTISSLQQFGIDVSEFIANLSEQTPLKSDEIESIAIILNEIQNNAIEHGNKSDELKKIKISGAILVNCLIIKIDDEGSGFDASKLINPFDDLDSYFKERDKHNKRPGGLGLAMANKVMDSVTFNERGNSIIMTKYF